MALNVTMVDNFLFSETFEQFKTKEKSCTTYQIKLNQSNFEIEG